MKNHWITNCPHFQDGDKTAENRMDVDCEICLDKLSAALEAGSIENRIIDTCPHCGKDIYDWSDLGCEYCDRRHPGFGMLS